jgi:hypothetical protein
VKGLGKRIGGKKIAREKTTKAGMENNPEKHEEHRRVK